MPRTTTKSLERKVSPDRRYQSILVQRLINKSMLDGKKHAAERAVYAALEGAAKHLKSEDPVEVFEKRSQTFRQILKLNHDALVAPTIRFHSQSLATANSTLRSPGSSKQRVLVVACHTVNA